MKARTAGAFRQTIVDVLDAHARGLLYETPRSNFERARATIAEARTCLLEDVRAQVARSAQDSAANVQLIPNSQEASGSGRGSLALGAGEYRCRYGATVDVLQAEDTLNEARLRYANAVTSYNQSQ
jgi:hypothetical protein